METVPSKENQRSTLFTLSLRSGKLMGARLTVSLAPSGHSISAILEASRRVSMNSRHLIVSSVQRRSPPSHAENSSNFSLICSQLAFSAWRLRKILIGLRLTNAAKVSSPSPGATVNSQPSAGRTKALTLNSVAEESGIIWKVILLEALSASRPEEDFSSSEETGISPLMFSRISASLLLASPGSFRMLFSSSRTLCSLSVIL
ncbi:unknown [Proteobacteria bacterium CAG:139]|nr:unknown [Proteobacteria bacterium CAG:139]